MSGPLLLRCTASTCYTRHSPWVLGSSRCSGANSLACSAATPPRLLHWPHEKTDWEKNHARDRSCFTQYRNNGFAAHRRRRQAPVESASEPGGGGQQKLVRDLWPQGHQRQLQLCHATTVSGPGVGGSAAFADLIRFQGR